MFRLWLFFVILQFLLSVGVVFAKDIKSYSEIPEDANPNYEVLEHYLKKYISCLLYTSPSPRDATLSRMPSSA